MIVQLKTSTHNSIAHLHRETSPTSFILVDSKQVFQKLGRSLSQDLFIMICCKYFEIVITLSLLLLLSVNGEKKKPNILLILADDVGQGDLSAYFDSSAVSTPNIDSLIEKGLMFTDTHSTPLCATSRYMLLSGNYQHRG